MKSKKDLDKCNKKELLDLIFTLVEKEAFEEDEINEILDLDEDELRVLVENLINVKEEVEKVDEDTKECDGHCKCEEEVDKDDDGKYRTGTRPNIYIFTEFYPMNGEEHKLYFDVDDFGTVSGTITAKITKN